MLEKLLAAYPHRDARIFVQEEDAILHGRDGEEEILGPNPKIRNMSRAYREAKGEVVWIVDCNVWTSASVCGLMVDKLCGFGRDRRKFKFVHQLPLAVALSELLSPMDPSLTRSK